MTWPSLSALAMLATAATAFLGAGADARSRQGTPPGNPAGGSGTALILGQVVDASSGNGLPGALVTIVGGPAVGGRTGGGGGGGAVVGARDGASAAPEPLGRGGGGRGGGGGPVTVAIGRGTGYPRPATIADVSGYFVFSDLPPGAYTLLAQAAGYAPGGFGRRRVDATISRPITLAAGQRVLDATIRLWQYAVVTGRVFDEAGDPIVGVRVRALTQAATAGQTRWVMGGMAAVTDDRGMYRMPALLPGDYLVVVPVGVGSTPVSVVETFAPAIAGASAPPTSESERLAIGAIAGFASTESGLCTGDVDVSVPTSGLGVMPAPPMPDGTAAGYATTYYPGTLSIGDAVTLTLSPGVERSGVDMRLETLPARHVMGVVTDAGEPARYVGVTLTRRSDFARAGPGLGLDGASTITDSAGRFRLVGVPAGEYEIEAAEQNRVLLRERLVVGDANLENLQLRTRLLEISGEIRFRGSSPAPLPAQVQQLIASLGSASGAGQFLPGARPDTDGRFTIRSHPPGRYWINVSSPGPPWTITSITVNGADALAQAIELTTSPISGVVVTFSDEQTEISGAVRGDAAEIDGASVTVFPADFRARIATGLNPRLVPTVTTSATGTFAVRLPRSGDYFIAAVSSDRSLRLDAAAYTALASQAVRVSLADGERREVSVPLSRLP